MHTNVHVYNTLILTQYTHTIFFHPPRTSPTANNNHPTRQNYLVKLLTHFMQTPHTTLTRAKWMLLHVSGTPDHGIWYKYGVSLQLKGFRNVIGHATHHTWDFHWELCFHSEAKWSPWVARIVTPSSTRAKYRGVVVVACEVVWLKRQLIFFNKLVNDPIMIHHDTLHNI